MHELPVVHRSERLLVSARFAGRRAADDIPQMDSEHADEGECVGVRSVRSKEVELGCGVLHQVEGGEGVGAGVA